MDQHAQGILDKARETVKNRVADYDAPELFWHIVAARWSSLLGVKITGSIAAEMMISMKSVRLRTATDPEVTEDTLKDIAGYALVMRACVESERPAAQNGQ